MKSAGRLVGATLVATTALTAPAAAQITYQTLEYPGTTATGVTGFRGYNITGSYSSLGGLLYRTDTGQFTPYPVATANGANFAGAQSSQPYSPSFGSPLGILRAAGTFTPIGAAATSSYLYDNAAAPGQQITVLNAPGAFNTIAHSQFGNQVVGTFNTTSLTGNIFNYNIATGAYTTTTVPGSVSSSAYGIWGNRVVGGYTNAIGHGFVYNQSTGLFTTYDAPGRAVIDTHFEGITAGGRANEFNLVAGSVDADGSHAWAVHIDANGVATWTELKVGNAATFGNSIYEDKAIGIYIQGGITRAYIATIPGLYTPVTNTGILTLTTPGTAISALNGDDVVNSGVITTAAPNSIGIAGGTYGVIQNRGTIAATAAGSTAVQMNGEFGAFLNAGTVQAVPGSFALATGPTAVGTTVVNTGTIDGLMAVTSGPFQRFENSGLIGISAAGAGAVHTLSGVFMQTPQGTFAPRVNASAADMIVINGVARLGGAVQANLQPGVINNSYTILQATGGYTGAFAAVTTNGLAAFLSPGLAYIGNSVNLTFTSTFAQTAGLMGDQISTGRALDWAYNAGPGLSAMPGLFSLTAGQLQSALTMLSGDSTSLQLSSAFSAGGQFNTLVTARPATRRAEELAQATCQASRENGCQATGGDNGWGFWANALGGTQWLNADSSTGAPASQSTILGGAFGADYRVASDTLLGLAFGMSSTNYWMPTSGANGYATGVHLGLYAAHEFNGFYVNGTVSWSNFSNNQTRFISGIGNNETEQSSGSSNLLAGRIEIGRPFDVSLTTEGQVAVTPFLAFQPANLWTPAMTERSFAQTGATGTFGLSYQPQSTVSLPTFLGAQVDGKTLLGGRPVSAWVRAAWVHEFMNDRSVTAGFNVLPGTAFTVDGARAASDAARIDVGLKYAVGSQTSLFANGNVELSGRGQTIAGTVGLRYVW